MGSEVAFFRDALIDIADAAQALWTLNLTVAIAAVGWGTTSRSWQRGLSLPVCAVASVTLTLFFALNLASLNMFYGRAAAASRELQRAWSREGGIGSIDAIYASVGVAAPTAYGPVVTYLVGVLAIEVLVSIGVGVLLSNLGRAPPRM